MITNWMLVAVNALIIVSTIAYAEQDPNAGEGQMISKGIFSHILSKINLIDFRQLMFLVSHKKSYLWYVSN